LVSVYGQNRTYFGIEFSVANDIYKVNDNGDYLIAVALTNSQGGINLRQEIKRNIFIETGLMLKYYQEGFGFKTMPFYTYLSSNDISWIIPVRIGLNLNVYKNKVHFTPIVGYSFGINPPPGYGLRFGKQTHRTTEINYNYAANLNISSHFSLVQTGLGFEFTLFKLLLFSVSANYYSGFNKINQLDINYTVNNSNQTTGTATSKGEFWCVSTGLKYPVSNFWTRKKG